MATAAAPAYLARFLPGIFLIGFNIGTGSVTAMAKAGVSSQFPNVLMLPWLLCDCFGWSRDMRRWDFRIMVLIIAASGLVVPFFGARPSLVMIASQAFGALIFPATVLCVSLLASRRSLMREHAIGAAEKTALGLIFGFSLYMSFLGLRGLFDLLEGWGGSA